MPSFTRFLAAGLLFAALASKAQAQADPLVSKAIAHVFAVSDRVFAFNDPGDAFSRLDLFANPPAVGNGIWPYSGGAEGGAPWRTSLLLRANPLISDSVRVARLASLYYDGKSWKSDSLLLPQPVGASNSLALSAGFSAMAVWHDTLILGFGKLGIGTVALAAEAAPQLLTAASAAFAGLPTGADSTRPLITCAWNATCRVDSLASPAGGLDSVIDLAVDSSAADSIWLLIATSSGLRRGLLGGHTFPRVSLPGIADTTPVAVQRVTAAPDHGILWAFTLTRFFFSRNHGLSFQAPPNIPGLTTTPSALTGFAAAPQAATFGDSAFVNFYLTRPGLVAFRNDSLQRSPGPAGGEISDVLIDADDSLNISSGEGNLTQLCIVRNDSGAAVLAVGSEDLGLFYRRLNGPSLAFADLNRLRNVQGSLGEIITYPTVLTAATVNGAPSVVHIGYRLKNDAKVTITVFNYAMEKVRVLVRNAPRRGHQARSENPLQDQWDGRDAGGRFVSVGTYYVLVESDQGERGFGKILCARGRQ